MRGAASGHAGSDGHHQHLENRGPQIEPPSNDAVPDLVCCWASDSHPADHAQQSDQVSGASHLGA
ncbi:hypothetical protein BRADI_1g28945v3 [Brachypodium distachyon]|uniref:Uncharacterized protein n=1 Tax=Brachypodium distachyon TaxID=15368 RepID=A0A0Q3JEP8_BRADI|nr:hypothetical protein BRADI_1g28945v3 [Brachypodium distachyon]